MEKESENRLPFLDVLIDNNQVPVLTTVFRKSTFTGLLMNFTSFTSYSYKLQQNFQFFIIVHLCFVEIKKKTNGN